MAVIRHPCDFKSQKQVGFEVASDLGWASNLGVSRWSLFWKFYGGLLVPISAYLCPLGVAILRY